MTVKNTAFPASATSRTLGYRVKPGQFRTAGSNLPMRIAILAEAETGVQAGLSTVKREVTSAAEAGSLWGFKAPITQIMRILRPQSGSGVGTIPTTVYPQASDEAAVPKIIDIYAEVPVGGADKAAAAQFRINERTGVDGSPYSFAIPKEVLSPALIQSMADAINRVVYGPMYATVASASAIASEAVIEITKSQITALRALSDGSLPTTTETGFLDLASLDFTVVPDPEIDFAAALTATLGVIQTAMTAGVATIGVVTSSAAEVQTDVGEMVFSGTELDTSFINFAGTSAGGTDIRTLTYLDTSSGEYNFGHAAQDVCRLTSSWSGSTANQCLAEVEAVSGTGGVVFDVRTLQGGSGGVDISGALAQFGTDWETLVVNSYDEATLAALEAHNGVPGIDSPTGRYNPVAYRPYVAYFGISNYFGGNESDKDFISAVTDAGARQDQVTNSFAAAPNSKGFTWEASANWCYLRALQAELTPHTDTTGPNSGTLPDMPAPVNGDIGDMAAGSDGGFVNRQFLLDSGASTVSFRNGKYFIEDPITTYHPIGENPPQWRYVRALIQDWNVEAAWFAVNEAQILDKAIKSDSDTVGVEAISPKDVTSLLIGVILDLVNRNLIVDADFSISSIELQTGDVNPDSWLQEFSYKRSPYGRQSSAVATAGFAFGIGG